ncbi:uncharacterized protein [Prorops nasuta]|uniref:uncharacterized protein n=1 Tax=Prorops nasuta TaxID=863751 RepID=UPI0034CF9488
MDYSSFIYYPYLESLSVKIERIQYVCLRQVLGYRSSTPTNILLGQCNCMHIKERAKILCSRFLASRLSNHNSIVAQVVNNLKILAIQWHFMTLLLNQLSSFSSFLPLIHENSPIPMDLNDYRSRMEPIRINTDLGFAIKESNHHSQIFLEHLHSRDKTGVSFFTDASKFQSNSDSLLSSGRAVGCASLSPELNISLKWSINQEASIFTGQAIALLRALELLTEINFSAAYIYSDSISVLQAIANPYRHSKINPYVLKIKKILNGILKNKIILLYWIPSHVGIKGNDKVDKLAKEACVKTPSSNITLPYTDFFELFGRKAVINFKNSLFQEGTYKGTIYFDRYYRNCRQPWFKRLSQPRDFITWVNRARSNHYHLRSSLARVKIIKNAACDCGNTVQDLNHILWNCPLLEEVRSQIVARLRKLNYFSPYSIEEFLALPKIKPLSFLFGFLKSSELLSDMDIYCSIGYIIYANKYFRLNYSNACLENMKHSDEPSST